MNLRQMATLKRWHVDHRDDAPIEYHAWDLILTLWVLGWMAPAPAIALDLTALLPLCVALFLAPRAYVALRRRLHERGRLRCDWLLALA